MKNFIYAIWSKVPTIFQRNFIRD
jgi:F-type H+/Na+-transporting ATPase subunit alpha